MNNPKPIQVHNTTMKNMGNRMTSGLAALPFHSSAALYCFNMTMQHGATLTQQVGIFVVDT